MGFGPAMPQEHRSRGRSKSSPPSQQTWQYPSWPPSLIRMKIFAYLRGQQSSIGERLIRMKNFAYTRSHKRTDVSSCFVVSDKAYYNLAVKRGRAFYNPAQHCWGPLTLVLSRWERTEPALLELSLCTS